MTHIVVAGAGVAGLSTALALHKAGISVAVYEAAARETESAFLVLARNGMHALAQIDAADAVIKAGHPARSMRVRDEHGAEIATAPLDNYHYLHRSALCAALAIEAEKRGIPIQYHARLVEVSADKTIFQLPDKQLGVRADLLIGADGINSAVRAMIAPARPRYAGQQLFYGRSPIGELPFEPDVFQVIHGSTTQFGYLTAPGGDVWWFARLPGEPLETFSGDWRARLAAQLKADTGPAGDIVATAGRIIAANAEDLPPLSRWHRANMVLIGDAAHAASPASGQGASMAIEDAVILGKALRDNDSISAAVSRYVHIRRDRVEANTAYAAGRTAAPAPDKAERARHNAEDRRAFADGARPRTPTTAPAPVDWDCPLD